ncbi:hypothetical protein TWF696_007888 [Orbilia brochopaga]|uniref:Uncharacterized protein n=1 Tax=Orbilia brochopaga TaxID=3140254 RepID=A0AAV9ULF8_9PEZI
MRLSITRNLGLPLAATFIPSPTSAQPNWLPRTSPATATVPPSLPTTTLSRDSGNMASLDR